MVCRGAWGCAVVLLCCSAVNEGATQQQPNIVFFLADDQDKIVGGWDRLGAMEKTKRLVGEAGASFDNAIIHTPVRTCSQRMPSACVALQRSVDFLVLPRPPPHSIHATRVTNPPPHTQHTCHARADLCCLALRVAKWAVFAQHQVKQSSYSCERGGLCRQRRAAPRQLHVPRGAEQLWVAFAQCWVHDWDVWKMDERVQWQAQLKHRGGDWRTWLGQMVCRHGVRQPDVRENQQKGTHAYRESARGYWWVPSSSF